MEGKTFNVRVERLDKRGQGQGVVWRENKKGNIGKLKLTIPYTIPGEEVQVTVAEPLKRRWKTRLDEIITKHPDRVEAPCPHFEKCGGCSWQHYSYEGQLREKTNLVKGFVEQAGFDPELVEHTLGAENPWHYRNKMEFTFGADGSLGMHEPGNFRSIVPLQECLIMRPDMKAAVLEVGQWAKEHQLSGYNKDTHEGLLRHVMVRQSFVTDEILLGVFATEAPGNVAPVEELIARIEEKHPNVKSFMWLENHDIADRAQAADEDIHLLAGRDFIYDELMGYRFRVWYDTFFQPNPKQAQKLVELAIEMGQPKAEESMIDLFCGVGTFSLPFASRVKELAGIEIVETSIQSAKRNASDNGIDNTYFLAKDARNGIVQVLEKFGTPDLLLLDPPRSGAGGKVMRRIGRAQPSRIIYVSCNPESFAEDIKQLEPYGYKLRKVQPVDMFPHTFHVECVSFLERTDEIDEEVRKELM